MKKPTKKTEGIKSCCNDCGKKRYEIIRDAGTITICMGICPFCKEEKPIVPANDWIFMMGETDVYD